MTLEWCFFSCLHYDFFASAFFLSSAFVLLTRRSVLELANRLVGSADDLFLFLEAVDDLEVLLAGYTYLYGLEGHFVVRAHDEDALDVALSDLLRRRWSSRASRRRVGFAR